MSLYPATSTSHMPYAPGATSATSNADAPPDVYSSSFIVEFAQEMTQLVDSYMTGKLNNIRMSRQEVDALNGISAVLAQYAGRDKVSDGDYDKVAGAIKSAAESLPDGSPVKEKLEQMLADKNGVLNTDGQGGTDRILGKDEISSLSETISSMEKDAEQRGQDDSLVVQQKIGDRATILSQATELIRDQNETAKNIISKWG